MSLLKTMIIATALQCLAGFNLLYAAVFAISGVYEEAIVHGILGLACVYTTWKVVE